MENLIGKDKALFLDKLMLAQPILSSETVRMINFIMGEDSDCEHASPIRECAFFVIGRLYPVQGCQINDLVEAAKKVVGI